MREDLGMLGTEYNLAVTCFQIGQILGPSGFQAVIRSSFIVSSNSQASSREPDAVTCATTDLASRTRALVGCLDDWYLCGHITGATISDPILNWFSRRLVFCRHTILSWVMV